MMGMKPSAGPCKYISCACQSAHVEYVACAYRSAQVEHIVYVCQLVNAGYEAIILADRHEHLMPLGWPIKQIPNAIRQANRNEYLIQSDGPITRCYQWANGNDSWCYQWGQ
jgi:hypothetical protein